jgi:RNA polymerase sigma factor (sigma-70 family)
VLRYLLQLSARHPAPSGDVPFSGWPVLPERGEPAAPDVTAGPTFPASVRSYPVTVERDETLADLARRALAGDGAALEGLLRALEPLVVRTTRLVVGSGSWAAEDAAQDALLDVARGIGTLREPEAVHGWALRIATTRAIKVARRERLNALKQKAAAAPELLADPGDARAAALKEAFDALSPRLRATAVLRLYVGLTEIETAQALGCAVGTVKSNLHDARTALSEALAERGFAPVVPLKPKPLEESA